MTEDDLDTDIAHGGPRPTRLVGPARAHRQNQWTLPAHETSSNQRSERRKKKKEREEPEAGASDQVTKRRQSRTEGSAWEPQEEEEKEQRRRRRKRKEGGKDKEKEPFSSVARCRNADIKIALVEEGIVWSALDTTAGSGKRPEPVTIPYERIISASWPQGASAGSKTFVLNYAEESGAVLRPKSMSVLVGEEAEAKRWVKYTNKVLLGLFQRPKKVRVFLHVENGRSSAASTFKTHGFPKLREYNIDTEITEVSTSENFANDIESLDQLSDYDGFLVVGNQLSLRFLLNAVMSRAYKDQDLTLRPGTTPLPCPLPLGLLPTGRRGDVATSVHGTSDFVTSLMHFVLGSKMSVDVCAIFGKSKFHGWAVNCQYGYAANALHDTDSKRIASDKRFQSALAKMLSKERLLTYDCDVHYIPTKDAERFPTDRVMCTRGCEVCEESVQKRQQENNTSCDQVVELNALGDSQSSNSMIELQEESRWRTLKGSFLWVGLYVLPCRNEIMGPRGMSPYAHLSDGCADLVLVRDCKRKEFLRFLKRHGAASKSHLDFTFVETHRVTGVRFQARQNITWEHRDVSKSEIDYHMETQRESSATTTASSNGWDPEDETPRQKRRTKVRSKPIEMVIDDCGDDESDEEEVKCAAKPGMRHSASLGVLRCSASESSSSSFPSDDEETESGTASGSPYRSNSKRTAEDDDEEEEELPDKEEKKKKKKKTGLRRLSLFLKTTEANSETNRTYVRPRLMLSEMEHAKRKERAMRKEDKLRKMAEERLRSVWMADYEVLPETDLEFQIHSNLVEIFACGPPAGEKVEEVRLPWLPIF